MMKRLHWIPKRKRFLIIALLVASHALPLLWSAVFLLPDDQEVFQYYPLDPTISFLQADSILSVSAESADPKSTPVLYTIRLDTHSQTNKPALIRHDINFLYQDGFLIGTSEQMEEDVDTIIQRLEVKSKYNHLFQAVTLHQAQSQGNEPQIGPAIQHTMSHDYLYVSATKYGGLQSFHEPETLQHHNWKKIIDRQMNHQLNMEWNYAFQEFELEPDSYYLFPFTQLPLYSEKDELPGISSEYAPHVIRQIWQTVYEELVIKQPKSRNPNGSTIPLILLAKDGTHLRILLRFANGSFHEWVQEIEKPAHILRRE